ncbi:MAG: colicin E3 [Solirubrobacteraceae bacterium]|nr:colicin E3 [Solirubrobacteraceae bacterium]
MVPVPPPKTPPGFPDARLVKPKTGFPGGVRKRWKLPDGRILEWDYRHGAIEAYTPNGKHLGQFDSHTGEQTKPADATRTVEP